MRYCSSPRRLVRVRHDPAELGNQFVARLGCLGDAGVNLGDDVVAEDLAALFSVHGL
jgi:hypothetical protein